MLALGLVKKNALNLEVGHGSEKLNCLKLGGKRHVGDWKGAQAWPVNKALLMEFQA